MDKKIVAVDFDGTLIFNHYPTIENPNVSLLTFIKEHRDDFVWILNTARHNGDLGEAIDYLKDEWGIVFDYVNENVPWLIEQYGDCRKVVADYYIDDRNLTLGSCLYDLEVVLDVS